MILAFFFKNCFLRYCPNLKLFFEILIGITVLWLFFPEGKSYGNVFGFDSMKPVFITQSFTKSQNRFSEMQMMSTHIFSVIKSPAQKLTSVQSVFSNNVVGTPEKSFFNHGIKFLQPRVEAFVDNKFRMKIKEPTKNLAFFLNNTDSIFNRNSYSLPQPERDNSEK